MQPRELSARHAAYTWARQRGHSEEGARQIAGERWQEFLPVAHEGWGRLLGRVLQGSRRRERRRVAAA